ncbi:GH116 family glycosyl hydrolase, partial [Acidianus sp. RZ1]|uniref:GH116 family glycosyl hydrolase n=1 Tax=Acidianus sp. RZ1 TaxID=1540082 RepID=UPI00149293AB
MKYEFSYSNSSGVALGGIGSGTIEIRPDGLFYDVNFFTTEIGIKDRKEYILPGDIFLVTRKDKQLRILASTPYIQASSPYTMPWVRPVEKIVFEGKPPFAFLKYDDIASTTFFSPIIPLNLKDSSLPLFEGKIESEGEVTLFIKPSFNFNLEKGEKYVKIISDSPKGDITVFADNVLSCGRAKDIKKAYVDIRSKGFAEDQGEGEYVFISMAKSSRFTMSWFYPTYKVRDFFYTRYYAKLFKDSMDIARYYWENSEIKEKTRKFYDIFYNPKGIDEWIVDLIGAQISTLKRITVLLENGDLAIWESIYDPDSGGPEAGAFNTTDVLFYYAPTILILYPELLENILKWTREFSIKEKSKEHILYTVSFPENLILLKERMKKDPSILSDMNKLAEVVSEIAKKTGKDPIGRIPHLFTAPMKTVDSYHMVDNQIDFIIISTLLSAYTGKDVKNDVIPVIRSFIRTQIGDYGLPYHTTPAGIEQEWGTTYKFFNSPNFSFLNGYNYPPIGYQTFDVWSMLGYASYTSIMWYSSLFLLRNVLNIEEFRDLENKAKDSLLKLWNGKYYDLWFDPESGLRDKACAASQLMGFWYSRLMGYNMEEEEILKEIIKNNLIEGEGVINGVYLDYPRPSFNGNMKYNNGTKFPYSIATQMDTPWEGVEFALASHLLYAGMREEAE